MADAIVLTGVVATTPRSITTADGLAITSFRLASGLRRFDRESSAWVDAGTNWYSVSTFRKLAQNAAKSLTKGDRVLVTGRIRVREWEGSGRTGTTVEVEADALGHDLTWGTSSYVRRVQAADQPESSTAKSGSELSGSDQGSTEASDAPRAQAPIQGEVEWAPASMAAPF